MPWYSNTNYCTLSNLHNLHIMLLPGNLKPRRSISCQFTVRMLIWVLYAPVGEDGKIKSISVLSWGPLGNCLKSLDMAGKLNHFRVNQNGKCCFDEVNSFLHLLAVWSKSMIFWHPRQSLCRRCCCCLLCQGPAKTCHVRLSDLWLKVVDWRAEGRDWISNQSQVIEMIQFEF